MSKHLTLSDRAIIEKYLAQDMPFSYIAKRLHRSPSTISREVKNRRCFVNGYRYSDNPCINYRSCIRRNLCDQESIYSCHHRCKNCTEFNCNELCSFNCKIKRKKHLYSRCFLFFYIQLFVFCSSSPSYFVPQIFHTYFFRSYTRHFRWKSWNQILFNYILSINIFQQNSCIFLFALS